MGLKYFVYAILSAILIGLTLNHFATPGSKNLLGNVRLTSTAEAHEQDKKVALNDWSLFGNTATTAEEKAAAVKNPEAEEKVDMSLIDTSSDDPEPDNDNTVYEIPNDLPVQGSSASQTVLTRCVEVAKVYHELKRNYDLAKKYHFTTPDARVCALGHTENGHKPICLGARRGEPCPKSSQGAEGSFQTKRATALEAWVHMGNKPETYDPEQLEDNMAVAIHYLESMEKQFGEDLFRAYNGGGALRNGVPNYKKPGKVDQATLNYDRDVRSHIPIFQAALEGKIDMVAVGNISQSGEMSSPLPDDAGPITSGIGEARPYRNGTHMGFDIHAKVGTPIKAIRSNCKVVRVGWNNSGGKGTSGFNAGVAVIMDCGNGTPLTLARVCYFHLSSVEPKVVVGYRPKAGEVLGTTGDTGGKNGKIDVPHLHFETHEWSVGGKMIAVNPSQWTNMSPFAPNSSLYRGPRDGSWKAAKVKFLAMDQKH